MSALVRVLVCGGRAYTDKARVFRELDELEETRGIQIVLHGGAPGADDCAEAWANQRGVLSRWWKAEWNKHGRAAGPIRNETMLREGKPDLVLAFPGGRGTADMVRRALAAGVEVIEVKG